MSGPASIGLRGWAIVSLAVLVLGWAAANSSLANAARSETTPANEAATWLLVNRAHKGDRLDTADRMKVPETMLANPASAPSEIFQSHSTPRLMEACEPVASPYVDPGLAEFPGVCFG